MQSLEATHEDITRYYTTAIDALYEIGRAYYTLGKSGNAQHLLRTSLQLLEASEVKPQYRLKLLLLYGQVLIVDHFACQAGRRSVSCSTRHCRRLEFAWTGSLLYDRGERCSDGQPSKREIQ